MKSDFIFIRKKQKYFVHFKSFYSNHYVTAVFCHMAFFTHNIKIVLLHANYICWKLNNATVNVLIYISIPYPVPYSSLFPFKNVDKCQVAVLKSLFCFTSYSVWSHVSVSHLCLWNERTVKIAAFDVVSHGMNHDVGHCDECITLDVLKRGRWGRMTSSALVWQVWKRLVMKF